MLLFGLQSYLEKAAVPVLKLNHHFFVLLGCLSHQAIKSAGRILQRKIGFRVSHSILMDVSFNSRLSNHTGIAGCLPAKP